MSVIVFTLAMVGVEGWGVPVLALGAVLFATFYPVSHSHIQGVRMSDEQKKQKISAGTVGEVLRGEQVEIVQQVVGGSKTYRIDLTDDQGRRLYDEKT